MSLGEKLQKASKIIFMVFTLSCILAVGVCVIVNYAVNQQITWAAYPILSVALGWLVITPLIFGKYMIALCATTVAVNPFLYLIDRVTPDPDWFCKLGFPCAIVGIVFFWIIYALFRFVKINIWYKAAISMFLGGVVVSPLNNYFVDKFLQTEPSFINYITNIFSCLAVAALLWIVGYIRSRKQL